MPEQRPLLQAGIVELEGLADQRWENLAKLRELAEELGFRDTSRARQLRVRVTNRIKELEGAARVATQDSPVIRVQDPPPPQAEGEPSCPECGAPMVRRRATKGPNAGGRFWGCSRYPNCRGVRAGSPEDAAPSDRAPKSTAAEPLTAFVSSPRDVRGEPRAPGWQHVYFQSAALPYAMVRVLHRQGINRELMRSFSHWRLDHVGPGHQLPEQDVRNILSVAEKILTRGTVPLCPQSTEQLLEVPGGEPASAEVEAALAVAVAKPSAPFQPIRFESHEEELFWLWLASAGGSPDAGVYVVPQIHLASIADGLPQDAGQRGDFLLSRQGRPPCLVEVDGGQHASTVVQDRLRDDALRAAGIVVIRVPVAEVRAGSGPALDAITTHLGPLVSMPELEGSWLRLARWTKWLHQCQLAATRALHIGWLVPGRRWEIGVVFPEVLEKDDLAELYAQAALEHVSETLERLGRLYGIPVAPSLVACRRVTGTADRPAFDLVIAPSGWYAGGGLPAGVTALCLVSDALLPVDVKAQPSSVTAVAADDPGEEDGLWFLRNIFRKQSFLEGQWAVVSRTLRGLDSIVLLPTGAGKSIAFQLASLLLPGQCIVVDPIISLIDDQTDNLRQYGIDRAVGISSNLDRTGKEQALEAFASGHHLFCYVAPERFQMEPFRDALRQLTVSNPVSAIVIDEAHCVSEWGHDFRTAYLNIARISREYCESNGSVPPLVALTGTASRIVLKDVQRELGVASFDALVTPTSFDRQELRFSVQKCWSTEKRNRLKGFIQTLPAKFGQTQADFFGRRGPDSKCGLVFCPHVNGDFGAVEVADALIGLGVPTGVYTGTPPRGVGTEEWNVRKRDVAHRFKRSDLLLLSCTSAFGMGIDKPNIRYTVHLGLPKSIESFYQEAGRAGRDHDTAHCCILLSNDNPARSTQLLGASASLAQVAATMEDVGWGDADDITRALYFHVNAFAGEEDETQGVTRLLETLAPLQTQHDVFVSWQKQGGDKTQTEKALHRLVVLGVIRDYTVDYSSSGFAVVVAGASRESVTGAFVRYIGAYQQKLVPSWERRLRERPNSSLTTFVKDAAALLVRFVYEHIEQTRRRALATMFEAASSARSDHDLRRRVLEYLQQSEWDERLEAVRTSAGGGFDELAPLFDDVVSPNDAAGLRGAASRMLSSYADVPGLLAVRAFAEALADDCTLDVVIANIQAAIQFGLGPYTIGEPEVATAVGALVINSAGRQKMKAARAMVDAAVTSPLANRGLIRELTQSLPAQLADVPAEWLLATLVGDVNRVVLTEEGVHGR